MPRPDTDTTRHGPARCTYYGRFAPGSNDPQTVNCRVDTAYGDRRFHTDCLGCGLRVDLNFDTDPQVLLDQARAALLNTQSKIAEVRRVTGSRQAARATLARTNEALAALETLLASVIAA